LGTLHSTLPAAGASHLVCGRGEKLHFAKLNPEKTRREKKTQKLGRIFDEDLSDLRWQKYAT